MALVEPGPFGTDLLTRSQAPARADVLRTYGELGAVPTQMAAGFAAMLSGDGAPDPRLVVDTYLALANAPAGKRATRTVVGITWNVDEINIRTQSLPDNILREMQLEGVLRGAEPSSPFRWSHP